MIIFRQIQVNLSQFSSSCPLKFIPRWINFREFLQKYVSRYEFVQTSQKSGNFLPANIFPLKVFYRYTFPLNCYSFPVCQKSVFYDNLYNRLEYMIFGVFLSAPPPSDLNPSLPLLSVLIIPLFMYILT